MKTLKLIGLQLLLTTAVLAQNNTFPSSGNVGIGTTSPFAVLDVAKHLDFDELSTVFGRLDEGNTIGNGTFLGVKGYSTNTVAGKSFSIIHNFYGETNSSINFHRGASRTGGFISFNTGENIERLRIDAIGNVGIGTISPNEKLSVDGKIRAKEVKVEVANWPDYVFKNEHNLISLTELENYIKTNKHLPEIPSAKEAEANGVALGEMNKLLLKKIEELTLHLIEKDKELTSEKERLTKLEAVVKEIIKNK